MRSVRRAQSLRFAPMPERVLSRKIMFSRVTKPLQPSYVGLF